MSGRSKVKRVEESIVDEKNIKDIKNNKESKNIRMLKFKNLLEKHSGEKHLIVNQSYPDPDSISCSLAHQIICKEYNIETDIIYNGLISHQENVALVKLLGIDIRKFSSEMDLSQYKYAIFVDNQGTTTNMVEILKKNNIPTLFIVDHHELQNILTPELQDIRKIGAAASIYIDYITEGIIELDKNNPEHSNLATALMHGIRSETNNLLLAKPDDFKAVSFICNYIDTDLLSEIVNVKRSHKVIDVLKIALENRMNINNFCIAGVGYLRCEDRDSIPQAADFLLTEENIHTSIVYGIIMKDGEKECIIGSLRTSKITLNPDSFLKEIFGKDLQGCYYGGGKNEAGGFEIPIGFLSGNGDDEYLKLKWKIYDQKIKKVISYGIGVNLE